MSDINATLEALITKAPEGYPEDYAEWACPYCEKPVTVDGADDMILHVASEHENKKEHKMRDFCNRYELNYADVMTRLGDPHIVVGKHVEKPAPAPVPQVVDAPKPEPKHNTKPCICGYVGVDGKDAGKHKRSCVIWKAEMGKAPEGGSSMTDEQLFDVFAQAIQALSGLDAEAGKDVKVYEDLEAKKARLAKWEEVKPTILPLVALGYGKKEYEVCEQAFKELKVRLDTKIAFSEAYQRGQKAHNLILEQRIQERSKLVKECSDLNSAVAEKAEGRAASWVAAETMRFEQLLDGRMRVQGSGEDTLTFVYNTNWTVSSEVARLAKAKSFTLADEPYICDEKARMALEAVGFLAEKSFPVKGTHMDVSDDGKIVSTKNDSEVTATLPLGQWANRLTKVLLYVRKVYRSTDKKVNADQAMTTDEFKDKFGFVLQEADPGLDVARWRVAGRKAESKPKASKAEEGINAFGAAMQKANLTVDDILAAKPNGEANQRQPKKSGKKGKRH